MSQEHIDYGYTGSIAIPKEIRGMSNTVIKLMGVGLSLKQMGIIGVGLAVCFAVFKICMAFKLDTLAIVLVALIGIPVMVLAFVRPNKMDMEDWLMIQRSNRFLSAPVRMNNLLNEYEKLEDMYDSSKAAEKQNLKEKKPKEKTKKQYTQYKAFM